MVNYPLGFLYSRNHARIRKNLIEGEDSMTTASERATHWLNDFDAALKSEIILSMTALFEEDCYWRDLVSFTWNIKTMEGKTQIADMLLATLKNVKPSNWKLAEEATGDEVMTEAWITFETSVDVGEATCA
jgi:putative flavoprotein involved in K+ transport